MKAHQVKGVPKCRGIFEIKIPSNPEKFENNLLVFYNKDLLGYNCGKFHLILIIEKLAI